MSKWYRSSDLSKITNLLNDINANPAFPANPYNAKTGLINTNFQVENWCTEINHCTDGKFGFPGIPDELLLTYGITIESKNQILAYHECIEEEYSTSWFL